MAVQSFGVNGFGFQFFVAPVRIISKFRIFLFAIDRSDMLFRIAKQLRSRKFEATRCRFLIIGVVLQIIMALTIPYSFAAGVLKAVIELTDLDTSMIDNLSMRDYMINIEMANNVTISSRCDGCYTPRCA